MASKKTEQATDHPRTPPLEDQLRQLTLRVADLEKRVFELENQAPPEVE